MFIGRSRRSAEYFRSAIHKEVTSIKDFVVYNLTVLLFTLSCKNLSKASIAISNHTAPYIQAESYTQTKESYNYRLSLINAMRLMTARHPFPGRLRNIPTELMIF